MNKRRKTIQVLIAVSVAVVMMAAMVAPALAQQGPEIQVTDFGGYAADQPDVAVDSNGNVHIVYFYADEPHDIGNYSREIFYTMLGNNGNTLIDDTQITDTGHKNKHPDIAVDSNDMVHVVWHDRNHFDLAYSKIDPSLDDQNGDPADPATILLVDDIALMDWDDYSCHPRMAIDSNDDIHIVWELDVADIYYMKVDNNGNVLVAPKLLRDCYLWYARPYVAVDSNDNVHITWNDNCDTDSYEIYYMMLRGSDGSTLIDATLITPDDDENSKRQTIVVDAEEMVHIFWGDYRSPTEYNEVFHTKLDPSRDDQNGDAANEGVITVIDDTMLTPDDGDYSTNPQSAIHCGRYIHVAWYDNWDSNWGTWDVYYMVLDTEGDIIVPETVLTTNTTVAYSTRNFDNQSPLAVDSNGKAHIVWCDERHIDVDNFDYQLESPDGQPGRHGGSNNYTDQLGNSYGGWEVYYTNYQGPSCTAAPIGPGNCIYLHCEDGLFNLTAPVDTQWHELWPFFCRQYHLSSWNDTSGNGALSHCDWIDMYEKPDGEVRPYHVEDVTITLYLEPEVELDAPVGNGFGKLQLGEPMYMYIELEGGYDPAVLTDPVGTQWHEIYPNFCTSYNLTGWTDNGNSTLDLCDYIYLIDTETQNATAWHVLDVAIDIVVCREPPPVGGEAYPVDKASLLAPWIAVGVVLAGGISWYVLRRRRAQS